MECNGISGAEQHTLSGRIGVGYRQALSSRSGGLLRVCQVCITQSKSLLRFFGCVYLLAGVTEIDTMRRGSEGQSMFAGSRLIGSSKHSVHVFR